MLIPFRSTSTSSWPVSPPVGHDSNCTKRNSVNWNLTKSCISIQIPSSIPAEEGQPTLPLGDYLGEFTNELDQDDHIVEFAPVGPKHYGYRTKKGKVECKVRGFSLNTRGRQQLSVELLKQNVINKVTFPLEKPREIPVFKPHKITRDVNARRLETFTEIKRYKLVFDKRVVERRNFFSYPYGYLRPSEEAEEMERELNEQWGRQDDVNVKLLCPL